MNFILLDEITNITTEYCRNICIIKMQKDRRKLREPEDTHSWNTDQV